MFRPFFMEKTTNRNPREEVTGVNMGLAPVSLFIFRWVAVCLSMGFEKLGFTIWMSSYILPRCMKRKSIDIKMPLTGGKTRLVNSPWIMALITLGLLFCPGALTARVELPAMVLLPAHGPEAERVKKISQTPPEKAVTTLRKRVKNGDTPTSILKSYLPLKTIYQLDAQSRKVYPLTRIRRGQPYTISLLEDSLYAFEYEIDSREQLVIQRRESNGKSEFDITKIPIPHEIREAVVATEISTTLSGALDRVGETQKLAWKLADIFAWDIDFSKDIKPGDHFRVLVEKKYRRGKFFGYGRVLAAVFTNRGTPYHAYYFEATPGRGHYYSETGASLQKAFLKSPVNYSRISSRFSKKRFHPILKKYKAHLGVDYAAPRNTPIKAVADGTISAIGYGEDAGRYITLGHRNGYETSYFHMNKFKKGLKRNQTVSQGDVIGYVGKTGLATGYHLCFRMKQHGKPVNPMAQPSLSADPISRENMADFLVQTRSYHRTLRTAGQTAAVQLPEKE